MTLTLTQLVAQINASLRGEEDVPVEATDENVMWVLTVNRKIAEWAKDIKQTWSSNFRSNKTVNPTEKGTVATTGTTTLTGTGTYFTDYAVGDKITVSGETERTIDTITSNTVLTVTVAFSNTASSLTFTRKAIIKVNTQEYSLHRNFLKPSDTVIVTDTDNNDHIFKIVEPQQRTVNTVYISSRNPEMLVFNDDIDSTSPLLGGTLKVAGYYIPEDMSASTDIVPVDDPFWLVYAVASEIAFNDVTYEDKYVDLNTKSNNLYQLMCQANRRGTSNNPRKVLTNVRRIYSPDTRN